MFHEGDFAVESRFLQVFLLEAAETESAFAVAAVVAVAVVAADDVAVAAVVDVAVVEKVIQDLQMSD